MKRINLYGEDFEVIHPRNGVEPAHPNQWQCTDIYQAYKRPSEHKLAIWKYWSNFGVPYEDKEWYHIGIPFISSYNTFAFTVTANVYDPELNFLGVMVITKDHNRLYLNK